MVRTHGVAYSEEVKDDLRTFAAWIPGRTVKAKASETKLNMRDRIVRQHDEEKNESK